MTTVSKKTLWSRVLTVLFSVVVATSYSAADLRAQTLFGALTSAYNTNPTLKAAQSQAFSTNETYRQAVGAA